MFHQHILELAFLPGSDKTHLLKDFPDSFKIELIWVPVRFISSPKNFTDNVKTEYQMRLFLELIGAAFSIREGDSLPLIQNATAVYNGMLNGDYSSPIFEQHAQEWFSILDHLSYFAYSRYKSVQLDTWKNIFKNILGIGDFIISAKENVFPLTLKQHYLRVLFNVYMYSHVTDFESWDLLTLTVSRWNNLAILTEQWKTNLNSLVDFHLLSTYGTPFGTKGVITRPTQRSPDTMLPDCTYQYAMFLFDRILHVLGNPNAISDVDVYSRTVSHLTFVLGKVMLPESTLKDKSDWVQIRYPPPPVNNNLVLSFVGTWMCQAVVSPRPAFFNGEATASGFFLSIFTCLSALPFENFNLSLFVAALCIALSPQSNETILRVVLNSLIPLVPNDIIGGPLIVPILVPLLRHHSKHTDPKIRFAAIVILSSFYSLRHVYPNFTIPALTNTDTPYLFFNDCTTTYADIKMKESDIPAPLRRNLTMSINLPPFFRFWRNLTEKKPFQLETGESFSHPDFNNNKNLYSVTSRPNTFEDISSEVLNILVEHLKTESNEENFRRILHSLSVIFHENILPIQHKSSASQKLQVDHASKVFNTLLGCLVFPFAQTGMKHAIVGNTDSVADLFEALSSISAFVRYLPSQDKPAFRLISTLATFTENALFALVVKPASAGGTSRPTEEDQSLIHSSFVVLNDCVLNNEDFITSKDGVELIGKLFHLIQFSIRAEAFITPNLQTALHAETPKLPPHYAQSYGAFQLGSSLLNRVGHFPTTHHASVSTFAFPKPFISQTIKDFTNLAREVDQKGKDQDSGSFAKQAQQIQTNLNLSLNRAASIGVQKRPDTRLDSPFKPASPAVNPFFGAPSPSLPVSSDTRTTLSSIPQHASPLSTSVAPTGPEEAHESFPFFAGPAAQNPFAFSPIPEIKNSVCKHYMQNNFSLLTSVEQPITHTASGETEPSSLLFISEPTGDYCWNFRLKGTAHVGRVNHEELLPLNIKKPPPQKKTFKPREDDVLLKLLKEKKAKFDLPFDLHTNEDLSQHSSVTMVELLDTPAQPTRADASKPIPPPSNTLFSSHPFKKHESNGDPSQKRQVFFPSSLLPHYSKFTNAAPRFTLAYPQSYSYNTISHNLWAHLGGLQVNSQTIDEMLTSSTSTFRSNTQATSQVLSNVFNPNNKVTPEPSFLSRASSFGSHILTPLTESTNLEGKIEHFHETTERACHKIGCVYVKKNQVDQNRIFHNHTSSPAFVDFTRALGWFVHLPTHRGFLGKLDREGVCGFYAPYHADYTHETLWHVPSMWPTREDDDQQVHKKRHVGNDHIHVIWTEHHSEYRPETVTSQFNFVHIVVSPIPTSGHKLYRVRVHTRQNPKQSTEFRPFGPVDDYSVVTEEALAEVVRQTAINADMNVRLNQPGFARPFPVRELALRDLSKHKSMSENLDSTLYQFIPRGDRFFITMLAEYRAPRQVFHPIDPDQVPFLLEQLSQHDVLLQHSALVTLQSSILHVPSFFKHLCTEQVFEKLKHIITTTPDHAVFLQALTLYSVLIEEILQHNDFDPKEHLVTMLLMAMENTDSNLSQASYSLLLDLVRNDSGKKAVFTQEQLNTIVFNIQYGVNPFIPLNTIDMMMKERCIEILFACCSNDDFVHTHRAILKDLECTLEDLSDEGPREWAKSAQSGKYDPNYDTMELPNPFNSSTSLPPQTYPLQLPPSFPAHPLLSKPTTTSQEKEPLPQPNLTSPFFQDQPQSFASLPIPRTSPTYVEIPFALDHPPESSSSFFIQKTTEAIGDSATNLLALLRNKLTNSDNEQTSSDEQDAEIERAILAEQMRKREIETSTERRLKELQSEETEYEMRIQHLEWVLGNITKEKNERPKVIEEKQVDKIDEMSLKIVNELSPLKHAPVPNPALKVVKKIDYDSLSLQHGGLTPITLSALTVNDAPISIIDVTLKTIEDAFTNATKETFPALINFTAPYPLRCLTSLFYFCRLGTHRMEQLMRLFKAIILFHPEKEGRQKLAIRVMECGISSALTSPNCVDTTTPISLVTPAFSAFIRSLFHTLPPPPLSTVSVYPSSNPLNYFLPPELINTVLPLAEFPQFETFDSPIFVDSTYLQTTNLLPILVRVLSHKNINIVEDILECLFDIARMGSGLLKWPKPDTPASTTETTKSKKKRKREKKAAQNKDSHTGDSTFNYLHPHPFYDTLTSCNAIHIAFYVFVRGMSDKAKFCGCHFICEVMRGQKLSGMFEQLYPYLLSQLQPILTFVPPDTFQSNVDILISTPLALLTDSEYDLLPEESVLMFNESIVVATLRSLKCLAAGQLNNEALLEKGLLTAVIEVLRHTNSLALLHHGLDFIALLLVEGGQPMKDTIEGYISTKELHTIVKRKNQVLFRFKVEVDEALMSDRGHKRTGNEYNKYSYTPQPSNERRQSQQTRTQKPRYESIPSDGTDGPQRSIEGYIIFISNLHEEVGEDQVKDFFLEFGNVTNIRMNLDHRTGAMKEYALVEYQTYQEALTAVEKGNGAEFLGKQLLVNFAFKQPPTRRLEPPQPVVETDVGEKQMIVDPQSLPSSDPM
ncbi:putative Ral GTPase-activating protein subunit alpha-2 [Blattamonas nauphoetae]|uniref:Ral GTPase-activating protein subunit alpha-2 n=1 Tax=Blattamonas nauphoetae TaxID=2049346 RepID=A0ABQ9XWF2_9EUKA|nr:putative Ral GTPase-activating protein subunit alpha-2 [Blattamonas nauphoetae]